MPIGWGSRRLISGPGRRQFHILNVSGGPRSSLRRSLNLFQSPELKMILNFLRSPSHLIFVASNVALLAHLQFYSTVRRKQRTQEFLLQMEELENYIELINDLDAQNDEVQKQIASLKFLQKKDDRIATLRVESGSSSDFSTSNFQTQKNDSLLSNKSKHAQEFFKKREVYASVFSKQENIAKLFPFEADKKELYNQVISPPKLTYYSEIQNTLMALSNHLIKSFLVELNLRNEFKDHILKDAIQPDSFLFHEDLFALMKDDEDKRELITKLLALRATEKNHTVRTFLHNLDRNAVAQILDDFMHSESFKSDEQRRHDFYEYKSRHWLNYEESDTFNSIQARLPPEFNSNAVSSKEYIQNFEKIFATYEKSSRPLKHMNLALELARALATGGECIPTCSVFRYLLDNLGKLGLYNYQSLVYDMLLTFGNQLASSAAFVTNQSSLPKGYSHLIEDDPDFLGSLITYQVSRKNLSELKELILFFEVIHHKGQVTSPVLPSFMQAHPTNQIPHQLKEPQLISIETISKAICACVELKQYSLLDNLVNKLVQDLIQTPQGLRIVIGASSDKNWGLSDPENALCSESILLLLAKAYIDTKDAPRAKWLIPHIDTYLQSCESSALTKLNEELHSTVEARSISKKPAFDRGVGLNRVRQDSMRTTGKYSSQVRSTVSAIA